VRGKKREREGGREGGEREGGGRGGRERERHIYRWNNFRLEIITR
jgi:hypothetical protein